MPFSVIISPAEVSQPNSQSKSHAFRNYTCIVGIQMLMISMPVIT